MVLKINSYGKNNMQVILIITVIHKSKNWGVSPMRNEVVN